MVTSNHLPFFRVVLPWALALFAGVSSAQAQTKVGAPKSALLTTLQYSSPIKAYQGYEDQPVQSWRKANDRVGQIGGWRAYAKEARTEAPAPTKDASPASDPHTGHHGGDKR